MPDPFDYSQPRPSTLRQIEKAPLITYLLCALSVLITTAYLTSESMRGTLWYQIGHFGYVDLISIWDGHYWGLFTAIFIHASLMHIAFNMYWVWRMGRLIETTLHPLVYILFILSAAVVSSAAEILLSSTTGIGMSGVGYALFGLMWAARGSFAEWRSIATRENLNLFVIWGIFCVVATYYNWMPVANAAHGAGFLFGLSVGWLFFASRKQPLWAIPLGLLLITTILAVTWMPWSGEWTLWKGNREFLRRHYPAAIEWYRRSLRRGGDSETNWENISRAWNNIAYEASQRNDEATESSAEKESDAAEQKAKAAQSTAKSEP